MIKNVLLVVSGLSILVFGLVFLLSHNKAPLQPEQEHKTGLIPEFEPSLSPPPGPPETTPTNRWPERAPHPDGRWRHGEGPRSIAVTNGCLVTYPHYPQAQLILPHPTYAAPFKNLPDNEIARILSSKPGDIIIDVPLPHDFDERFAKVLHEPIVIEESDTPEKKELKQQVIEAREMLAKAMAEGKSPRAILEADAKELRRLMDTRDNYQRILDEEIQNGASDQDIADLVHAANRALEQNGIEGNVRLPFKLKLHLDREKAAGRVLN